MSDEMTDYFINVFQQINYPAENAFTEEARELFEQANQVLSFYRGHPNTLFQAIHAFWATNNATYAYTGAASVLKSASYISNGNFSRKGTQHALLLMEKAKWLGPNRFEVEIVEAEIFAAMADQRKLRAALDDLQKYKEAATSSLYASLEMSFWDKKSNLEKVREWYNVSLDRAENEIRRLNTLNKFAGILLLNSKNREEVIDLYRQVVQIDENDPWAWHNLSTLYFAQKDYEKSGECNRRALDLMPFQMAEDVLDGLVRQWKRSKHKNPLKEYPRY